MLSRAWSSAREPASAELRCDVHALELGVAVSQGLDPSAAGRRAVDEAHDVGAAGRGEVRGRRRGPAIEGTTGDGVVLGEDRGDEVARPRMRRIAPAEHGEDAVMVAVGQRVPRGGRGRQPGEPPSASSVHVDQPETRA